MYTFKFSKRAWFLLCMDMRARWLWAYPANRSGHVVATDIRGRRIVFVHSAPTGELGENITCIRDLEPDVVVCCHPYQTKRLYPDLPIVGDWLGKTHGFGPAGLDRTYCIEEDQREA